MILIKIRSACMCACQLHMYTVCACKSMLIWVAQTVIGMNHGFSNPLSLYRPPTRICPKQVGCTNQIGGGTSASTAASSRYLPDGCRTAELCGSQHYSTRSVSATRCVCIKNGAWKIQSSLFIKSCPLLLDGWGTPSSSLAPQWIGMGNMDTPSSSAPS